MVAKSTYGCQEIENKYIYREILFPIQSAAPVDCKTIPIGIKAEIKITTKIIFNYQYS